MTGRIKLLGHFRRLADFKSREDRVSFWPYAALVLAILIVSGWVAMIPLLLGFQSADQPNQFTFEAVARVYIVVTFGLAILLYGAAMVRRLRDSGRSGLWALMPVPFIAYSGFAMSQFFGSVENGSESSATSFNGIVVSNGFYMLTLLALIVLLAMPSTPQKSEIADA